MKHLKTLGLLLAAVMLLASVSVSALMIMPEDGMLEAPLPVKVGDLFTPDFSADKVFELNPIKDTDVHITALGSSSGELGVIKAEKGKLVLDRKATGKGAYDAFKMWINSDETAISDKVVAASFDVQREKNTTGFEFRLTESFGNGAEIVGVALNRDGTIGVRSQYNTGEAVRYSTLYTVDSVNQSVKFTLMYNPMEKTGSAWVTYKENGAEKTVLLSSGAYGRAPGGKVYGVYCYSEEGDPGRIEISNLTFYEAEPTAIDKSNYAINAVNGGFLGIGATVKEDVALPSECKGAALSYSTESDCIAIENGNLVIKRVSDTEPIPASLKVTAGSGNAAVSTTIDFSVVTADYEKVINAMTAVKNGLLGISDAVTQNIELPSENSGAALSYSTDSSCIAVENNKLVIKEMNINANIPASLKVTASSGAASMTETINFEVAVDTTVPIPYAPAESDCLYYEDFEDITEVPSNISLLGQSSAEQQSDSLAIENGRLKYIRNASGNWDGFKVILPEAYKTDGTVVEYELERPSATANALLFTDSAEQNSKNTRLFYSEMRTNGKWDWRGKANAAGFKDIEYTDYKPLKAKHVLKIKHYFSRLTYDIYLDDKLVGKEIPCYETSTVRAALKSIQIATQDLSGDFYLDNVKVYMGDVWVDPITITTPPPSKAVSDFELAQTSGSNTIYWESSSEAITIEGSTAKVTVYDDRESKATLTAYTYQNGVKVYKTYDVTVPMNTLPPMVGEYIYNENFDDAVAVTDDSGNITGYENIDGALSNDWQADKMPTIENGRVKVEWKEEYAGGSLPAMNLHFKADKSAITSPDGSRLAFEFEVENTTDNQIQILLSQPKSQNSRTVDIRKVGSNVSAYNGNATIDGVRPEKKIAENMPGKVKYTAIVDFEKGTYDLYLDGIKYAENFVYRSGTSIGQLAMVIEQANVFYVDNVKVYCVGKSLAETVDADYKALSEGGFAAINASPASLVEENFAYEAPNGSSVKFSSEKGLVNENGTINRPKYTTSDKVTAVVYNGAYEQSVVYDVIIAGETVILPDVEYSGWDGNTYYAVYTAYTLNGAEAPVKVIVAAYEDGKLIKLEVTDNTVGPKPENIEDAYAEGSLTLAERNENTTIKAFVFEDLSNIIPLADVIQ